MESHDASDVFDAALQCLAAKDVDLKVGLSHKMAAAWRAGKLGMETDRMPMPFAEAGRPDRPLLVPPRDLRRRRVHTIEGRASMWHAIAHIEFNAINLAWDAVYRFRDMPKEFYDDWVRVADEEAYHFELIRSHLQEIGYDYGAFPAHGGLWDMAGQTASDVMVRMALVPRVLEARGLDVTPGIMRRLTEAGDNRAEEILSVIFRDEVGHVAVGTRWFRYCCQQRQLDPESTFFALLEHYMKGELRGPFLRTARLAAGFTEDELERLAIIES